MSKPKDTFIDDKTGILPLRHTGLVVPGKELAKWQLEKIGMLPVEIEMILHMQSDGFKPTDKSDSSVVFTHYGGAIVTLRRAEEGLIAELENRKKLSDANFYEQAFKSRGIDFLYKS